MSPRAKLISRAISTGVRFSFPSLRFEERAPSLVYAQSPVDRRIAKQLHEFLQLGHAHIGHRPIGYAAVGPADHMVAVGDARARRRAETLGGGHADEMLLLAVDQRRHRVSGNDVDAPAHHRAA